MKLLKNVMTMVVAGGLLSMGASSAVANTIVVDPTPLIGGLVGGSYLWSYDVRVDGDSTVETGDFFTIFDFAGLVAGSQTVIDGWTATSSNLGPCPVAVAGLCGLEDSAAVTNITWTRTGANILGPGPLGTFSARSIYNTATNDWFVSQDRDNQLGVSMEGAAGNTNVPLARAVPEPASMVLLGLGMLGAGIARRRKQ